MPVSTLTIKYQATIPKPVREALQLAAGDRIEFGAHTVRTSGCLALGGHAFGRQDAAVGRY